MAHLLVHHRLDACGGGDGSVFVGAGTGSLTVQSRGNPRNLRLNVRGFTCQSQSRYPRRYGSSPVDSLSSQSKQKLPVRLSICSPLHTPVCAAISSMTRTSCATSSTSISTMKTFATCPV